MLHALALVLALAPLDLVPTWHRLEAELVPPAALARHGASLAVSGTRVAAGAPDPAGGRVLLWRRDAGGWTLEATIAPADGALGDGLGSALDLEGGTLVVGAPERESGRGAVYVFTGTAAGWTQRAKLAPADLQAGDRFGAAVALVGTALAIGAPGDDDAAQDAGSVRVFAGTQGLWSQQALLFASAASSAGSFGSALALQLDAAPSAYTLLVGAPGGAGAGHVLAGGLASWSERARLLAPAPSAGDAFGASVALLGDLALVGAPGKAAQAGAVFEFVRQGAAWSSARALDASGFDAGERLGASLALRALPAYEGAVLIGAPGARSARLGPGAFTLRMRLGGSWYAPFGTRFGPHDGREEDECGAAVAWIDVPGVSSPVLLAGAPAHVEGLRTGALYVHLLSDPPLSSCFGGLGGTPCPCGNDAVPPYGGCDNAAGTGGVRLEVLGYRTDGAGVGRAGFLARGFPPAQRPSVVLLEGPSTAGSVPFGDGILCLGTSPVRVASARAADGRASLDVPLGGASRSYQVLYRSLPAGFCAPGAAFNVSNAIRVPW